jgi:fructokinase
MIAGVETGGTKVICGVARREAPDRILTTRRFPTTSPEETIGAVAAFLAAVAAEEPLEALGVATFGPVNVEPERPRYGWITGTPKAGWADTPLLDRIPAASAVPTVVLSDVSGAALGEQRFGAGAGVRSLAYATVGTGIGVGLVVAGRVLHGNGWPELGHLLVRRHPADPAGFPGVCRFHGDCLEGLASGPAVLARWGADASSLPEHLRSEAFEVLGFYLAQAVATVGAAFGVERMVLGGGVLKAPGLLEEVRRQLPRVSGGPGAGHAAALDDPGLVVPPALGDLSGLSGALAAAADLLPAA